MRFDNRRTAFRGVLEGDRCVHPASVHDPIAARVADDIGFEIGMLAGSVASLAVLGAPDLILLTLSEFAGLAKRIGRASELPLMADADHGYGNALNVMRTVEELEMAGISGLSIEDTELPLAAGADGAARLLSVDAGIGKMKAALAGRKDNKLVIAGRTSALAMTGLDDCLERITAYEKVGVDAIFVVGAKTRAEVDAIADAVSVPIILGGAPKEIRDLDYLSAAGVRICLQGHQPFAAGVEAVRATLTALRNGTDPADLSGVASAEYMTKVTTGEAYKKRIADWL
jgi:carboxyvinyl-carboxyphosphonate phosphorylmutase